MDDKTELRLLLRIAQLEGILAAIQVAASRVFSSISIPDHVTAKNYSSSDTKRVPSRPLVTLRNLLRGLEQ